MLLWLRMLWPVTRTRSSPRERSVSSGFASRVYRCGQVIEASVPSDESGRKMTRTFKREGARFVPGESDEEEDEGA